MQFSKALPVLFSEFEKNNIDFALVGGLALYFSGASRTTFDADFMILSAQAETINRIMEKLGYRCLHKTEDVANYSSDKPEFGQVDFLFAHRKYALAMLQRAGKNEIMGMSVKVLQPEDLIGLKVQSSSNDPRRMALDRADIESMMVRYAGKLDWERVGDYFQLFGRQSEFNEFKKRFQ